MREVTAVELATFTAHRMSLRAVGFTMGLCMSTFVALKFETVVQCRELRHVQQPFPTQAQGAHAQLTGPGLSL